MNEKPSGRDAHLAEKKLAVNITLERERVASDSLFFIFIATKWALP